MSTSRAGAAWSLSDLKKKQCGTLISDPCFCSGYHIYTKRARNNVLWIDVGLVIVQIPESSQEDAPANGDGPAAIPEVVTPNTEETSLRIPSPEANQGSGVDTHGSDLSRLQGGQIDMTDSFMAMVHARPGVGIDDGRATASICELFLKAKDGMRC